MHNTPKYLALALALSATALVCGCKKVEQTPAPEERVIRLPPGLVHIGAQWVDGKVWVESFDPITNACLLRLYDAEGKVVEGSTKVRLKACRIQLPAADASAAPPPIVPPVASTISEASSAQPVQTEPPKPALTPQHPAAPKPKPAPGSAAQKPTQ
jgi:hypothetical protein